MRLTTGFRLWTFVAMTGVAGLTHAQLMNEPEPLPGIMAAGQPTQEQLTALADKGYAAALELGLAAGLSSPAPQEAVEARLSER